MSATIADVVQAAGEFAGLVGTDGSSPEITAALVVGEAVTGRDAWGDLADRAVILEACHQLSINHPGARPGPEYTPTRFRDARDELMRTLGSSPTLIGTSE